MLQSDVCIRNSLYDQKLTELRVLSVNSERGGKILGADYASMLPVYVLKHVSKGQVKTRYTLCLSAGTDKGRGSSEVNEGH